MTAVLSPCGTYRYRLGRTWLGDRPAAVFVMLNPSTADVRGDTQRVPWPHPSPTGLRP